MNRLPPSVLEKWKRLKHDLLPTIDKIKDPIVDKKDLKTKVSALYDQFDKGLSAKLKTASETKKDADAKAALRDAITIVRDYTTKTKTASARWGASVKPVTERFLKSLDDINDACTRTLRTLP